MTVGFRMLENIDTTATVTSHQLYSRLGGIGTLQNWHRFRQVALTHEPAPGVASCAVDTTSQAEVTAYGAVADGGGIAAAQLVLYEALAATTPAAQQLLTAARAAKVEAATGVLADTSANVFASVQSATLTFREMAAHLAIVDGLGTAAAQLALYVALPQVSDSSQALVAYATAAAAVTGATSTSVFKAVQNSGYNAHPTVSGSCARVEVRRHAQVVDRITITAHGIAIYNDMPAVLFNAYQPFTFGGHNIKTPTDSGVHLISFALYPNSYQPSGHINLSRAREFYLRYTSSVISSTATADYIIRSAKASSKCLASPSLFRHGMKGATPSNCGNLLKIQLLTHHGNIGEGQVNDLGCQTINSIVRRSKNVEYASDYKSDKMDNPQPSPYLRRGQRLRGAGCSSQTKCRWVMYCKWHICRTQCMA
jgi:hypothetical protein